MAWFNLDQNILFKHWCLFLPLPLFFVSVLFYFKLPSVHRVIQQIAEQRTVSCDSLARQELPKPYCFHKPFIFKLRLLSVWEAIYKIGFSQRVRKKVSLLIYNDVTGAVICSCSGKGSAALISLADTGAALTGCTFVSCKYCFNLFEKV